MSENLIEHLKDHLRLGFRVFWVCDVAREIVSVGSPADEPSDVGYFENGEYIALYGVDPAELLVGTKLFPMKRKTKDA